MDTESLKYARFDHPEHGSFDSAAAVSGDHRLTRDDKHAILAEWRRRVEADARADPDAARMGETLDEEIAKLAALKS
jgi:hypothetical protein